MHYCLYFAAHEQHAQWQTRSSEAGIPSSGDLSTFFASLDSDVSHHCTLIIPGMLVTVQEVVLPANMRRARLQQALPYALEEQLGTDVDAQHFALATTSQAGRWPAAVVAKTHMQQWLAPFTQQGVIVEQMLPDYLAIPPIDNGWHIVLVNDIAICRTGPLSGYTVEQSLLHDFVKLHLGDCKQKPHTVKIVGECGPKVLPRSTFSADTSLQYDEHTPALFTLFEEGLAQPLVLNLCQGEYQQKISSNGFITWLRTSVALLGICFLVFAVGQMSQIIYFKKQMARVDGQIAILYKKAYPQATRVTSPRARIEKDIKALGALPQNENFLGLLNKVGENIKNKATLNTLTFKNNEIQLRFKTQSFNVLESLKEQWQSAGLLVKQEQANSDSDGITAVMTFSTTTGKNA